jgi:hypothetical protein
MQAGRSGLAPKLAPDLTEVLGRLTEWGPGSVRGQVRHGAAIRDQRQVVVCSWQLSGATTVECESTSPGPPLMEPGICMGDGSSTEDAKSAGMSPLRLRVGVLLILLWIVPFWALAPLIADSLSGLSNPPSVAAVTTTIVVVQTVLGLLGFWVAGTQVKSIIKGSAKLRAIGAIWSMLLHGEIRGQGDVGNDQNEGRPPREDA